METKFFDDDFLMSTSLIRLFFIEDNFQTLLQRTERTVNNLYERTYMKIKLRYEKFHTN